MTVPRAKNPDLVAIHMRLRKQDVAAARRIAGQRSIPYQIVIRGWVTTAAKKAQREKMNG